MYTCNIYYESIGPEIFGHIERVMCCKISIIVQTTAATTWSGIASVYPQEIKDKIKNIYVIDQGGPKNSPSK